MDAVSYSSFRKNLKSYMQKVNQDSESLLVTVKDPEDTVVVMSKSDYDAMQETMYLLSNPDLMARIRRGDKQVQAGKATVHDLLEDVDDD
ncbi:type II toxin-antitoxin system Phd/YefM family antitoxin [Lacticaseibacillus jixianensis]|uniref:Antitoxin n=1 Tax=Lacticaseibacillus jixianensis TaxID=2486012 RepID=A0ABW4B638_9LACO|nr:type II toxin-antitoxin system Phd/YefM family antitoxin [Lacticaseibacillus jixianensis]